MRDLFRAPSRVPLVAPSILSASFAEMAADCRSVLESPPSVGNAGAADLLHLDVMDGHFVPNLTMGPDLCRSLRRDLPKAFLDVHLMVTDPTRYIAPFRDAGADHLTFHIEPASPAYRDHAGGGGGPQGSGYDVAQVASSVHAAGMTAGLAINPPTDVGAILPHLAPFDLILVMSVNPGYSGQVFIAPSLDKVRTIKPLLRKDQRLQMDGGVSPANAADCRAAGCDVLVAATAIFKHPRTPEEERNKVIASFRG